MVCRVFAPRKEPLLLSAVNDSVVRISPPSRWNGAPTTARKHRCSLMGVLFCLGRRTEGVQVVSGKPPASINVRQLGRKQYPRRGTDAPTTARTVGLPPRRGKYFLSVRKKVPKKASGTATTGKRPSIAHFDGGARNVARNGVGQLSPSSWSALVLAFFRRQNGRAFFPPLPIAALLPRGWRAADSNGGAWDASVWLGWFCGTEKQA